ncbi:hypothetical protein EQG64_00250 [Streptomyces sp. S6]|nr:hypothetical protein EQG64_00250 [Streptomyces sp. S6]
MLSDGGSGANFHGSSDWWIYPGEFRKPSAAVLRRVCSCARRGGTGHPLDREQADEQMPHLYDTSGPPGGWDQAPRGR